jgi:5-methylcytosine-specific restriction endonuclease McrA
MPTSQTRQSKARKAASVLLTPSAVKHVGPPSRDQWIQDAYDGFVQPNPSNRIYYRVILEELWPVGHAIPGPHVTESQLRAAINHYRKTNRFGRDPDKDYLDVFRRMRELRGEEALEGILNHGKTYQLANLTIGQKRKPRVKLSDADWEIVLERYGGGCANCKRKPPEVNLQQDHKVPRVRADKTAQLPGGPDALDNWQPLCEECNNFKSVNCRNCGLDCFECPWAYPEMFKSLRISPLNTARLLEHAKAMGADPDELINHIVEKYVESSS